MFQGLNDVERLQMFKLTLFCRILLLFIHDGFPISASGHMNFALWTSSELRLAVSALWRLTSSLDLLFQTRPTADLNTESREHLEKLQTQSNQFRKTLNNLSYVHLYLFYTFILTALTLCPD